MDIVGLISMFLFFGFATNWLKICFNFLMLNRNSKRNEMTANDLRNQNVSNMRLAWLIYGHKIQNTSEMKYFTNEELRDIYRVEDRERYTTEITTVLLGRGMNEIDVAEYLR